MFAGAAHVASARLTVPPGCGGAAASRQRRSRSTLMLLQFQGDTHQACEAGAEQGVFAHAGGHGRGQDRGAPTSNAHQHRQASLHGMRLRSGGPVRGGGGGAGHSKVIGRLARLRRRALLLHASPVERSSRLDRLVVALSLYCSGVFTAFVVVVSSLLASRCCLLSANVCSLLLV